jgi:hypothetical protein
MPRISDLDPASQISLTDNVALEQQAQVPGQPVRANLAQIGNLISDVGSFGLTWAGFGAVPAVGAANFTGYAPSITHTVDFFPPLFGTLVGWWDFSDAANYTQVGGVYQTVNDKSGNGHTLTAVNGPTLEAAAQNGLTTCKFVATSSQYFTIANAYDLRATIGNPYGFGCTVFAVAKSAGGGKPIECLGYSGGGTANVAGEWWTTPTTHLRVTGGGHSISGYGVSTDSTAYHMLIAAMSSGFSCYVYFDAVQSSGVFETVAGSTFQYDRIGVDPSGYFLGDAVPQYCDGWIGEILLYQGSYDPTMMLAVNAGVGAKWGIT